MVGVGNKARYRAFCRLEPSLPIFSRDWWLDALAGADGWDVALVEEGGKIVGSMPFVMRSRLGVRWLSQPPLTQTTGPWLRPPMPEEGNPLTREKQVMEALIAQLPPFDHFMQAWHYTRTNWLPFYWKGFSQTTRYTYVLPDLSDENRLWNGLRGNIRSDIRKASGRFGLRVRQDLGIEDLLSLVGMTFARQNRPLPYAEELVRRLDAACAEHDCRAILIATDPSGRLHAGEYIVWDENAAYGLMAGADPALRGSGATSLCKWEAIRFASKLTKSYDFEGSMLEPVERQFRAFGAEQQPYSRVWKTNSRTLQLVLFLCALL